MQNQQRIVSVTMQRSDNTQIWAMVSLSLRPTVYMESEHYIDCCATFRCNIMPLNNEAAKAFEEAEAWDKASATEEGEEYPCGWGGWSGWVMEGVHKGFMLEQTPDRGVCVSRLEGCLGMDGDVEGIIWAAALGVVALLGGDGSRVETPGWRRTQCRID